MAIEKTYVGKMGELQRINTAMAANSADLPDLEGTRIKLVALQGQAQDVFKKQSELRAEKQEISRQLKTVFAESDRLANVVRKSLKAHYGIRAEKLVEFGVQPFRGRKVKAVVETPEPPQSTGPPAAGTTIK
ncbi:MAG TPA: hypothetical protein VLV54_07955 [Thermoanaerobaculia bacterium]|nr:hypothetical protein [Thermoanaerobaculia bacterium]